MAEFAQLPEPHQLLDRAHVRERGTRQERALYHAAARYLKRSAIQERVALGRAYLERHHGPAAIDRGTGMGVLSLHDSPEMQVVLSEARRVIAEREKADNPSKGSLVFLASSKRDFSNDSAISRFALSPTLIAPITHYFGMLPILFGFDINRAETADLIEWSSHLFHFDPEDTTQIKVFVYLVDVDEETRPFMAIPAEYSAKLAEARNYTVGRLPDEQIAETVSLDRMYRFLGPAGTTVFCDTNRCLHCGGRPGKRIRDILVLYYALPTSTWFPLHPGDGERRNLIPNMKPRDGDPFDRALLGLDLA